MAVNVRGGAGGWSISPPAREGGGHPDSPRCIASLHTQKATRTGGPEDDWGAEGVTTPGTAGRQPTRLSGRNAEYLGPSCQTTPDQTNCFRSFLPAGRDFREVRQAHAPVAPLDRLAVEDGRLGLAVAFHHGRCSRHGGDLGGGSVPELATEWHNLPKKRSGDFKKEELKMDALLPTIFGALTGGALTLFASAHKTRAQIVAESRKTWIYSMKEECSQLARIAQEISNISSENEHIIKDPNNSVDSALRITSRVPDLLYHKDRILLNLKPRNLQLDDPPRDADRHKDLEDAAVKLVTTTLFSVQEEGEEEADGAPDNSERKRNDLADALQNFREESRKVIRDTWNEVQEDAKTPLENLWSGAIEKICKCKD